MFDTESMADMSVGENRQEALWAYDRCVTDADFSAWARKYGRHLASYRGKPSPPQTPMTLQSTVALPPKKPKKR